MKNTPVVLRRRGLVLLGLFSRNYFFDGFFKLGTGQHYRMTAAEAFYTEIYARS